MRIEVYNFGGPKWHKVLTLKKKKKSLENNMHDVFVYNLGLVVS